MLTWNFIEINDATDVGITKDGYTYLETTVDGWNDEVDFNDLTSLITVRTILYETSIDIHQTFFHPDVKSNVTALAFAKEALENLLVQAKYHQ